MSHHSNSREESTTFVPPGKRPSNLISVEFGGQTRIRSAESHPPITLPDRPALADPAIIALLEESR